MRVTVIALILSLGVCGIASAQFVVGMERMPPGSVLPAHTPPNQEEVGPWGERMSAKALYVAYDHTRSMTSFLTLSRSIPDWRTHSA